MKKNQWHGVDQHPELHIGQYIVPNFVSNSVAIQVSAHEYVLISPGEPLLAPFQSQFSSDVKLHIVFPNAYHHMGVTSWQQAYPDAKLYASRMAIQQLIKKGFDEKSINPSIHQSIRAYCAAPTRRLRRVISTWPSSRRYLDTQTAR